MNNFIRMILTIYLVGASLRWGVVMIQLRKYEMGATFIAAILWLLWNGRDHVLARGGKP